MENTVKEQNPLGYKPVSKVLASLAIPAVVANLVNALYNIVDQIFIGQGVGYLGNAATNIAFPIVTICLAIGLMIGVGSAANFNLELGRKILIKQNMWQERLRVYLLLSVFYFAL